MQVSIFLELYFYILRPYVCLCLCLCLCICLCLLLYSGYFERSKDRKVDNSEFGDIIPDLDEYTKEPPSLPPHLRLIILNKLPPSADPMALPEPQHVSLNHLYCTAIKDGMMVLGATQRYRQKYVTIVFYSVMAS